MLEQRHKAYGTGIQWRSVKELGDESEVVGSDHVGMNAQTTEKTWAFTLSDKGIVWKT